MSPGSMDRHLKTSEEGIDPSLVDRYLNYIEAFIDAFKTVDPDIQIIVNGNVLK